MKRLILIAALPLLCRADTINFGSGYQPSPLTSESNSDTGANVALANPDPVWAAALPDTAWEGIAQTGDGGIQIASSAASPYVTFIEDLRLPAGVMSATGSVTVYADDTAAVLVDGIQVMAPTFTEAVNCVTEAIGCRPGTGATIAFALSGTGEHRLDFQTYQLFGGPTGIDYAGNYTFDAAPSSPQAPEPATLGMLSLGSGLLIAVKVRRK